MDKKNLDHGYKIISPAAGFVHRAENRPASRSLKRLGVAVVTGYMLAMSLYMYAALKGDNYLAMKSAEAALLIALTGVGVGGTKFYNIMLRSATAREEILDELTVLAAKPVTVQIISQNVRSQEKRLSGP